MGDKTALTRDELEAIRHRIGTETAHELAECFEVCVATIYKWTKGLERARRRYGRAAVSDRMLLSMASRLKQVEIARQLGVSPAAVCIRLKKIKERGMRQYDEHFYQDRDGPPGRRRRAAGRASDQVERAAGHEA
jgi:predicted DNA-binding protein (UPF0251 family)